MSIFGSIRDAIFGKQQAPQAQGSTPHTATPGQPSQPQPAQSQSKPVSASPQHVDVDGILAAAAAKNGQPSNYKTSIVDLMKLLDLDSSLAHRKQLAEELGYQGARDGSAEMNIWLHREVMKKLAANGGRVSAELQGH